MNNTMEYVSREIARKVGQFSGIATRLRRAWPCSKNFILKNLIWTSLAMIQFLPGNIFAAEKLQADLIPLGLRARNEAPIPVEVRFKWDGARILEGQLQLVLLEDGRVLGQYRGDDLALTTGEQTFHLLLPPALAPLSSSQVEVQMKFITSGDEFDLGSSSVFMPTESDRSLVMGWCNSRLAVGTQASDLEQSLHFERFAPPPSDTAKKLSLTSLVRLAPEDLPLQPLSYTSYDIIVLSADGFAEARETQLRALARWVKGGGSVCVFVGGSLQPYHVSFLNQLADSSPDGAALMLDSNGGLVPGQKKILCIRSGVGRSVVVNGNVGTDPALDSEVWRQAVAFLWKFREPQARSIAETGYWGPGSTTSNSTNEAQTTIEEYAAQAQSFRRPNRPFRNTNAMPASGAVLPRGDVTSRTFELIDNAVTLTDAQKPKVKAVLDELNKLRQEARNTDPSQRRSKLQAAAQAYVTAMKEILTPDQYIKFQGVLSSRRVPAFNANAHNFGGLSYAVKPSHFGGELAAQLLPKTVRLIPFPALLGVLGLFLIMIGPADYFVLGFLRRRRYTWLLFPAMSIGFTLATVLMANYFLGAHDQRRSLVVVDLDKDGTALRWNRYELVFAARDKEAVTELKDALWAPVNVDSIPGGIPGTARAPAIGAPYRGTLYNRNAYRSPGGSDESTFGPPLYHGVVPTHFQTSEFIRQWQPELNRIFSFEAPPAPLLPNWHAVENAWPDLENIRTALSGNKPFVGDIVAISNANPVVPPLQMTQLPPPPPVNMAGNGRTFVQSTWVDGAIAPQIVADSESTGILPDAVLGELCAGDAKNLRSLVSQVSPTGGGNFEDVSCMDAHDSALAIVTQTRDDIIVYRRFFHAN